MLATLLLIEGPLRANNGCAGRSPDTSAVPRIADDFGAPRKSADVGHERKFPWPTARGSLQELISWSDTLPSEPTFAQMLCLMAEVKVPPTQGQ